VEDKGGPRDKGLATTLERTGNVLGTMDGGFKMSSKMALRPEETLAGCTISVGRRLAIMLGKPEIVLEYFLAIAAIGMTGLKVFL